MTPAYLLATLVATPFFASRAFLATFLFAALARWGDHLPLVAGSSTFGVLQGAPGWLTHDATLLGLGLMAAIEWMAERNPEARELLRAVDGYIKAGLQIGVALALIPSDAASMLPRAAAAPWEGLWALATGGGVLVLAQMRAAILGALRDVDADDATGLQGLLAPIEEAWVLGGVLFAVLAPVAALALFLGTTAALALGARLAERLDARRREPCLGCGTRLSPCAVVCPACGAPHAARAIGLLGQARPTPAGDDHALRLLARRRCPACAERLPQALAGRSCAACGRVAMGPAERGAFLDHLDRQLPLALGLAFLFGLVPVLGVVPAVLWARLSLTGAALAWAPAWRRAPARWLGRLAIVLLVIVQPIPGVGALAVPGMVLVGYVLARRALVAGFA